VQEAVHRIQPREMTQQAMDWMRELGYGSINLDLIYGLPHQTPESFNETLDTVLEMKPDRLAVFSYAHVPWIKPRKKFWSKKHLPTPETKLEVLKLVIERLTADNQYVYIGMDHFAKPNDELAVAQRNKQLQRNFQGYSTRAGSDIYAFGMSSVSQIPDAYWQNEKELPKWQAAVDAGNVPLHKAYFVTDEDKIRRETIMRTMCDLSLDFAAMSRSSASTSSSILKRNSPRSRRLPPTAWCAQARRPRSDRRRPPLHPQHRDVFRQHARAGGRAETFEDDFRNHRRWHHGVDRRVLSETQGRAGHGL
jgi:oxygen-independent coproporphyrinogen III oxidase